MLSARVAARAGLRNFAAPRSVAVGGLRTYAAAAQQDVRPPVALYGVDGTYANALVSFAIHGPPPRPFPGSQLRAVVKSTDTDTDIKK